MASPAAGAAIGLVPDTPAGRVFAEWLVALNSGDVERLRAFHAAHTPAAEVERRTAFDLLFKRTWGTLQVHSVRSSAERELTALMYATLSEEWSELTLGVDPFAVRGRPAVPPSDARDRALGDEELRPALDRYLGKLAAADVFSGSVRVVRGDEPVYEAALGLADQATKAANRADSKFNLGSMNKMFTAVSVAQLVERGGFGFDDPIATLLPDYPNRAVAGRVTVHHLLTHTSGLGDIFGPAYFEDVDRYKGPTDYFALFADEPLKFAPGERFEYSNAGFVVLGAIVERFGGGDYDAYVREHVYGPAGMTDSDSYERDAAVPNLATGYTIPLPPDPADLTPEIALGPRQANRATLPFKGSPAGGGYSTVGDLTRFHAALWRHALLGPALTERVTTGVVAAPFGPGRRARRQRARRQREPRHCTRIAGWRSRC